MRTTVNVHEAKTHLSRLLARIESGDEIVIARAGEPVAVLTKVVGENRRREPGHDRIVIAEDFDAPLPDFEAYR
jgi:prevent-host-death family protein